MIQKGLEAILYSKLYKKFRGPVFNYLFERLGDQIVAEEITQEVFLKAYRFRRSFNPQFRFSAWIKAIARNTLADWVRKNKKIEISNEDSDESAAHFSGNNPETTLIEQVDRTRIRQAINTLTELQKKVIFMRMIQHLSYREISKFLNIKRGAVKSLVYRAKNALRKKLAEPDMILIGPVRSYP
jgi:RNA polymerase sigma-70 factor (ECF subfamily)